MTYRVAFIDDSDTGGLAAASRRQRTRRFSTKRLLAIAHDRIVRGGCYDKVEDGNDAFGRPRYRDASVDEMMKKVVVGDWAP